MNKVEIQKESDNRLVDAEYINQENVNCDSLAEEEVTNWCQNDFVESKIAEGRYGY